MDVENKDHTGSIGYSFQGEGDGTCHWNANKCAKWRVSKTMSAVGSGITGHSDCLQPNNVTGGHILRAMLGAAGYTGSSQTCAQMGFNTSMGNGYAAINLPVGVADAFNKPIGMGGGDMGGGGMDMGGGGGDMDMDMF
eukprot:gene16030-44905_t